MNYLFELKTKLDYFYHMFSVMHTKEVIKECEEDTDDEESRSEPNVCKRYGRHGNGTVRKYAFDHCSVGQS